MKKLRNSLPLALIALVTVMVLPGCATGDGDPGDGTNVEDYMQKAEETTCLENKIVAASQTTRTDGHADPVNGILVTCEDGTLDWAHD